MKITKLLLVFSFVTTSTLAGEINVYSERQPVFLDAIFSAFEEETKIKVNVLYLDKGVIDRLKLEGQHSIADLAIVADIGRLDLLVEEDLVQSINLPIINKKVPKELRQKDNKWVALTKRHRVVFVANDFDEELVSFSELSESKYKNSICMRSATHPYNIALFADYLHHFGEEKTKKFLTGLKNNLARRPQANDRSQIKAVANGQCKVGIANLYYFYKMLNSKDLDEVAVAKKVQWLPIHVNQGVHTNVSGVALNKYAKNKEHALELINFLLGKKAQAIYANENYEIPISDDINDSFIIAEDTSLIDIAKNKQRVSELISEINFNN